MMMVMLLQLESFLGRESFHIKDVAYCIHANYQLTENQKNSAANKREKETEICCGQEYLAVMKC